MIEKSEKSEIVKYNPDEILKLNTQPRLFKKINSIELAIKNESDSLVSIKKKVGEETSLAVLKVWIINLNDFLNISRKMTPPQIDETAEMIMDEFYYLKVSDISLVFKRIKTGFYGGLFESLDGMKILDTFHRYAEERINYYINTTEREHNKYKC